MKLLGGGMGRYLTQRERAKLDELNRRDPESFTAEEWSLYFYLLDTNRKEIEEERKREERRLEIEKTESRPNLVICR